MPTHLSQTPGHPWTSLVREGSAHPAPGEFMAKHRGQRVLPSPWPRCWLCDSLQSIFHAIPLRVFVCVFQSQKKKRLNRTKSCLGTCCPAAARQPGWHVPFSLAELVRLESSGEKSGVSSQPRKPHSMISVFRATDSVTPLREDGPGPYHGLVRQQDAPTDGAGEQWKKRQGGGHPVYAARSILSQS